MGARIVVSGYLVRCPLGGYAWQTAHYLLGLQALGHDVWFYEDNGYYTPAYNPVTGDFGSAYKYGVAAADDFFGRIGCGDRWVFVDVYAGREYGPVAGGSGALLRDADVLISLSGVNRIPTERCGGGLALYIDLDPGFTQLRLAGADTEFKVALEEHTHLFTFGENIGTPRSPIPTGGYTWHPTRQPIVTALWAHPGPPRVVYTTVGKWDSGGRDLEFQGTTYYGSKQAEWLRYVDLPARTGTRLEMAMNVGPEETRKLLTDAGWHITDPVAVSADPWRYRAYLSASRGEFTVARDLYVRLRSGWFSDRAACYLAAGRPVVMQDTGYGDILPVGPGLHPFRSLEEAVDAVRSVEGDYARASAHAAEVARECFAAEVVLGDLLRAAGL
jgi:hypothetical protein